MRAINIHSKAFNQAFYRKGGVTLDEMTNEYLEQREFLETKRSKTMITTNYWLVIGGVVSTFAALLHIATIIGGASWYRFFGAGERMAIMAEQGAWQPTAVTLIITVILFIWAFYAFSGAGLIRTLPLLKVVLITIASIYIIRGLALLPALFFIPDKVNNFLVWSSLISLIFGLCYAIGTWQIWKN